MTTLAIDIETYSSVELKTAGEHAYAAAPDFSLLLFGYAFDDERVEVVDVARGERIPREVIDALTDPRITKTAFNASFERACISRALRLELPPEQWLCTMAWSLYLGLPLSLAKVGAALELDAQKDPAGEKLIKLFCTPKRRDLFGSGRTLPEHAPDQWERFIAYCRRDVEVEREIRRRLASRPMPEIERRVWAADQRINDRGVHVDLDFASSAVAMDEAVSERLAAEARDLTGLRNPSAVAQLRPWVEARTGKRLARLDKAVIAEVLEETRDPDVRRALELRLLLGKSSTKKYLAVESSACPDRRARGLLQYYGAARTGRWGGRRVQPQNMAKSKIADLDAAREAVKFGDVALVEALYGEVPDVLSQLVRTTLTAAPGHYLISSDFSAIEARVVAWLAGEEWVLDVFRRGEGIYEATASQMFGVPIEKVTKDLRTKGKIATLACGYGGGINALVAMGALKMGLAEHELRTIVDQWRAANARIVAYWRAVENAAVSAICGRPRDLPHGVRFESSDGALRVRLPAGRELVYVDARVESDPRWEGRQNITYRGADADEDERVGARIKTYGGKLVENITQAVARDCLAETLLRLEAEMPEAPVVLHIHDEVVLEVPNSIATDDAISRVVEIMRRPMPWAPDLPLDADAFATPYYRAD